MKVGRSKKIVQIAIRTAVTLLISILLVVVAGGNPIQAVSSFFYGLFGTLNGFAEIFVRATPLILLGLAVALSFKTGFFNLGADGQFYIGAIAATITVLYTPSLPGLVRILLAFLASFAAGGFWAFLPAWMKNSLGISETVSTIMFNYIAIMLVGIFIRGFLQDPNTTEAMSSQIPEEVRLTQLLYPTRLHFGIIIAVFAAFIVWFVLYRTTFGLNMQLIGMSKRAAYCNGLPVKRWLAISAIISGGLAGLAGMIEILGLQYRLLEGVSGGNGYTAVLIALLASNNPIGIIGVAIGYAMLMVGTTTMQRHLGIPSSMVSIIIGFIVVMVLSKDLLKFLKEHFQAKSVQ
jgi:simple sugar transport system permease protein